MAVNKPTGDNARKGAVRKRSQLKTKIQGEGALDQAQQEKRPVHGPEKERQALQGRAQREIEIALPAQLPLFSVPQTGPEGLRYQPDSSRLPRKRR
jgi:hypothetical protein